jgi:hypothetical protein
MKIFKTNDLNGGYRYAVDYIDKKSILRKNKFKKENILFKKNYLT